MQYWVCFKVNNYKFDQIYNKNIYYLKIIFMVYLFYAIDGDTLIINLTNALFSSLQNFKTLQDSTSHQIFERMHKVLNVAK
jgi:hypothetical protein